MGIERALLVLEQVEKEWPSTSPDVFIVCASPEAFDGTLQLAREVRQAGISAVMDLDGKSMKAQLRQADKSGAARALLLGPDEVAKGVVQVRDLKGSQQIEVSRMELIRHLKGDA